MFKNLSPMEVCLKMAAICQKSADQTPPGIEQDRLQILSDNFKGEADELAIVDLQQALLGPLRMS